MIKIILHVDFSDIERIDMWARKMIKLRIINYNSGDYSVLRFLKIRRREII